MQDRLRLRLAVPPARSRLPGAHGGFRSQSSPAGQRVREPGFGQQCAAPSHRLCRRAHRLCRRAHAAGGPAAIEAHAHDRQCTISRRDRPASIVQQLGVVGYPAESQVTCCINLGTPCTKRTGFFVSTIIWWRQARPQDEGTDEGSYVGTIVRWRAAEPGTYVGTVVRRREAQPGTLIGTIIRRREAQP